MAALTVDFRLSVACQQICDNVLQMGMLSSESCRRPQLVFRQLLSNLPTEKQTTIKNLIDKLPKELSVHNLLRNIRARFQQLENARTVAQKYEEYSRDDAIPPQLKSSASMQWPNFYLMSATPVAHEFDMEFQQDTDAYKVDVRFQQLVRSHQRSQRDFLRLHTQQCLQTAEERTSLAALQALADEMVFAHCELLVGDYSDVILGNKRQELTNILYAIVEQLREQNVFHMKSRAKKEQEKKTKREENLAKAELAWEALPPAALVGLAVHQETSGSFSSNRAQGQERISIGGNRVLQRLLQPHEAQLKDLGFTLDTSVPSSNTRPKQRGRSSSAESSSRKSILKPSRTRSATPHGARPNNTSRGSSPRSPARSASSGSSRNHGQRRLHSATQNKGKGKNKGNDDRNKGKGKGKGTGKSKNKGGGKGFSKSKGQSKGGPGQGRERQVRFQH